MNANRFGAHIDIIAFDGLDFAFTKHSQNAFGRLRRIMQQRVRS